MPHTVKELIEWIEAHELISPDNDSCTRFEPYYHIEKKELEEYLHAR
jgi:hypothetical protein